MVIGQVLKSASIHETPVGVAYLLAAKLLRVSDQFEQDIIGLPQSVVRIRGARSGRRGLTDTVSLMISRITVKLCSGLVGNILISAPSTPRRTMSRTDFLKVKFAVHWLKRDQLTSSEIKNVLSTWFVSTAVWSRYWRQRSGPWEIRDAHAPLIPSCPAGRNG